MKKLALATAIIGIMAIIILSQNLEPKTMRIYDINTRMDGQYVKVSGEVGGIRHSKITSFTMNDYSGEIYVFSYENLSISNGSYEIIGKVSEYHGILEIEASKIKKI